MTTKWRILTVCLLASLTMMNIKTSLALSLDEAAQLDSIEEGIEDLRIQRDLDNMQRRIERENDRQERYYEQQRRRDQVEQDRWMERCLRFNVCPVTPRPHAQTAAPLTPLAAESKAVREYDNFVTRNMTPAQIARYARQQKAEED